MRICGPTGIVAKRADRSRAAYPAGSAPFPQKACAPPDTAMPPGTAPLVPRFPPGRRPPGSPRIPNVSPMERRPPPGSPNPVLCGAGSPDPSLSWPRSMGVARIMSPAAPRQPVRKSGGVAVLSPASAHAPISPTGRFEPLRVRTWIGPGSGIDPDRTAIPRCRRPHSGIRASTPTLSDPSHPGPASAPRTNPGLRRTARTRPDWSAGRGRFPGGPFPVEPGRTDAVSAPLR